MADKERLCILHLCDITNNKSSGISSIVPQYIKNQARYAKVALINLNPEKVSDVEGANYNLGLFDTIKSLPDDFINPDLVVIHGIYRPRILIYYLLHIKGRYKYIAVPHGGLMKLSQEKSKIKKTIANLLFYKKFFMMAEAVQFLSNSEYNNSVNYYKKAFVIGNGVKIPNEKKYIVKNKQDCVLTYVGRIDPYVKGLDTLVDVAVSHKEYFRENDIKIVIRGTDYNNGYQQLCECIEKNNVEDIIDIADGGVFGIEKEKCLLATDYFIQLSRHEGLPSGILEALAYGIPVIISTGTGMDEIVNRFECGFIADSYDIEKLLEVISEAVNCTNRNELSDRAFMAAREYDWDKIETEKMRVYKNILKGIE